MPSSTRTRGDTRPAHPATVSRRPPPHAATVLQPKPPFAAGRIQRPPPHRAGPAGRAPTLPVAQRMEAPTKVLETTSSYRIEYDPGTNQVNLYSSNNTLLAHVAIQLDHNLNQIILHTHTDDKSGAVGGRGFMAALTMAVLRTVAKYFPTFVSVSMTPAVGAATKGLVSQLCGVLIGKMPLFSGGIYNAPVSASKELRAERKKKGAAKSKENDWDSGMMMETMYELAAIQKMEAKLQTGICILGIGPTTMGNLVGNGQLGAAFGWPTFGGLDPSDWYADASQGSGTLTFMIPMTFILSLFWFL